MPKPIDIKYDTNLGRNIENPQSAVDITSLPSRIDNPNNVIMKEQKPYLEGPKPLEVHLKSKKAAFGVSFMNMLEKEQKMFSAGHLSEQYSFPTQNALHFINNTDNMIDSELFLNDPEFNPHLADTTNVLNSKLDVVLR
eukprot:TRINITY_DN1995_c0_g1_i1.p1 TRINITY_DN1995_c0_g1~~TRINITY_DN1995_c0_g1_i1.p1  ORF type:complete len:149 (+),score=35.57 TRINITY_DN1995_c0_g1_i1:33-449(+)